jgi:hypothetical protein
MRKLKGSSGYLKNQTRKNLAKAALCLLVFGIVLFALALRVLLTLSADLLDAAGLAVSALPLAAFYFYLHRYRINNAGLIGEKQVTKLLTASLGNDYFLINALYLRDGGGDIDHLVLAPGGIFVLETKNWSGDITCHGDEWQRPGKPPSSPSCQVKRNAAKIMQIIDSSPQLSSIGIGVEGILVFTNNHTRLHLNNPTVTILRLVQLPSHITQNAGSRLYSPQQLEAIGKEILKHKQ